MTDNSVGTIKKLPRSATSLAVNCAGAFFACLMVYLLTYYQLKLEGFQLMVCVIAAAFVPVALVDLFYYRVYRRESSGLGSWQKPDMARVAVKLLGLAGIYAVLVFFYWWFPEYHKSLYQPFFGMLRWGGLWFLAASVPYFYLVDGLQKSPEDAYSHTGRMLLLRKINGEQLRHIGANFRSWIVKAFFLPIMVGFCVGSISFYTNFAWGTSPSLAQTFQFLIQSMFLIDVVYGTMGYVMAFRLLDSHIRSSDMHVAGWTIAIMCYPPFNMALTGAGAYFNFGMHDYDWGTWLVQYPVLYLIWGTVVCVLVAIYALATVSFGYRFSNITYRGIITSGAYRFSKHPAYVTKNIFWWITAVPFVPAQGIAQAICLCAGMLAINLIYYLRAISEERHLSQYPEFVEYALAMNERSIFRTFGKIMPFLQYKPPV